MNVTPISINASEHPIEASGKGVKVEH